MTAMPNHAPVITTLRPGILTITGPDGEAQYAVTGGFAEITPTNATILAERAVVRHPENRAEIEAHLEAARKQAADAAAHEKDGAEKFVADLVRLLEDME